MSSPLGPENFALSAVTLDVAAAGGAPAWVKVAPRGAVVTRDGRSYQFDPEKLVSRFAADGIDLPVDLDHAIARKTLLGERADAVGWVKELQARLDGLYARVEWLNNLSSAFKEASDFLTAKQKAAADYMRGVAERNEAAERTTQRRALERQIEAKRRELEGAEADVARGAPRTWQGRGRPPPGKQKEDVERLKFETAVLRQRLENLAPPSPPVAAPQRGPMTPIPPQMTPIPAQRNSSPIKLPLDEIIPRTAEAKVKATMDGIDKAISSGGEKAIATTQSVVERMKALLNSLNVTVSPTISPRFNAPAAGGGGSPAPAAPASPGKQSSRGPVHVVVNVNGAGDPRAVGREVARAFARLGDNTGALFDTV